MGKPLTVQLASGKMIIHPCSGCAYDSVRDICGLKDAAIGQFVYLTDEQIDKLRALSNDICVFKNFLNSVSNESPNGISGGVVATLTADSLSLPWVMIHIHRYGQAEDDKQHGINAGTDVIKEDVIALSANADINTPASVFQRFHADYSARYVLDFLYQKRMQGVSKGLVLDYNSFLTSSNALCCDMIQQPYQGTQEMISSLENSAY